MFVVNVGNVAPHVTALHQNEASVGVPVTLQGVLGDAGLRDDLNISINYGDGHEGTTKVGENSIPLLDPALTRLKLPGTDWSLLATHTYAQPGIYYGTIAVSDWGGGTDSDTFTVEVTGAQQITFPAVGDQTYGDELTPATGSLLSGVPVTYTPARTPCARPRVTGRRSSWSVSASAPSRPTRPRTRPCSSPLPPWRGPSTSRPPR